MTPKVSAIIATYHNPPRYSDREYVPECIESIRARSADVDIEIITVDCSPDGGQGRDGFPVEHDLIDINGPSVCDALRWAVTWSEGEWIIPMNADDRLGPHFVERAFAALGDPDRTGVGVVVVSAAPLSAAIERDNYIPYLAMFARWFWDEMGGFQDVLELRGPCLLADWDLWIRIWQRYGDAAPIAYIDDPSVIQIRNREGSASKWTSDEFERLRAELWKRRGIAS